MSRISAAFTLTVVLLFGIRPAHPSDFYQWTDEQGVTHFADSLEQVPEKYRNQVRTPEPKPKASRNPGTEAGTGSVSGIVATPPREPSPAAAVEHSTAPLGRFEIPYQAGAGSGRRVIIPVTFNGTRPAPMALDTGATGMVISFELAEQLGVFSKDQGTLVVGVAGVGGEVPAIRTIIDGVAVGGARDAFVPTIVTDRISAEFQGLIGMDFLSNYMVSIDTKKHVVVLQENPPNQDARGGHDEQWWRNTFREFRAARDRWREFADPDRHLGASARALADFQARESERLLQRLDQHASDHAVPQHWR